MTEEYEPEAVFPDDQYAGCVFVCKDPLPEDDNKVIREYFMDKYYRRWLRMTCIHKKERLMEHKWINYITKESAAHMFVRLDTGELVSPWSDEVKDCKPMEDFSEHQKFVEEDDDDELY